MAKFYGTFMQKQATKNHYVEFDADNESLARNAMFAHFGDKFMTVYTAKDFDGQVEQFNLKKLIGIQVIVYGHDSVEYKVAA